MGEKTIMELYNNQTLIHSLIFENDLGPMATTTNLDESHQE